MRSIKNRRRRTRKNLPLFFILIVSLCIGPFFFLSLETSETSSSTFQRCENRCENQSTCLDCLFPNCDDKSPFALRPSQKCFWCASRGHCMPVSQQDLCADRDERACPAVLHSKVPNNFRVIHVGIRKGGPEALIQLHLALNRWGFRTTLDTRHDKKQQGGPVVPFFRQMYQEEFSRAPPVRWVKDYKSWVNGAVEGDVLIATETWSCVRRDLLKKGVRQVQWHLTVWRRRNRSYCTIVGHTNYVSMTYMNQSQLALLYPYVSPHIVRLAQRTSSWGSVKRKQNPLVLYDSDTKLTVNDLKSRHAVKRAVTRASGFKPERLYELYGEASAVVDLALPGAERLIFEAVLFDACIVVDDALVGGCREDVPVPDEFRVPAGDLNALNAAVDRCVRDYDSVIGKFDTLKQFTLQQRQNFERQVRLYFSNSVHVVTVVCLNSQSKLYLVRFILNILLYVPFATVEIRLAEGVSGLEKRDYYHLRHQSWLAAVRFVELSTQESKDICEVPNKSQSTSEQTAGAMARLALLSKGKPLRSTEKTSLLLLFVPIDIIITDENIVHYITSQLALRRERRPPNPNEFTLFLSTKQNEASLPADVTLLALWTADAPHLSCAAAGATGVSVIDEICRQREPPAPGARRPVVLREVEMSLASQKTSNVVQGDSDHVLRKAWRFMCLHNLWRDYVGSC